MQGGVCAASLGKVGGAVVQDLLPEGRNVVQRLCG